MQSTRCGHTASTIPTNTLYRALQAHYIHWSQKHGRFWQRLAGSTGSCQGKKFLFSSLHQKSVYQTLKTIGTWSTELLLPPDTCSAIKQHTGIKSTEYFCWRLIKCGYEEPTLCGTGLLCGHQTSVQTLEFLWETGSWWSWSAAAIIMRTTLIADDKSRCQWRIWVLQRCQGSSWRNKAAFCFCSKAFCLWLEKKNTLMLHQNWFVIWS